MARRLEAVIRSHKHGAAVSIEGDFGSGKTYFLTNLRDHLKVTGLASVYFNAWESDFVENPLLVLMSDIIEELRVLAPEASADRMKRAAQKLWPILARVAMKSVLRAGSDEVDKLFGPLDEEVDALFAGRSTSPLSRHDVRAARAALSEILDVARENQPSAFPLVVLVDELDRSNPEWIVTFLESVKHLFGQEQIVFLVATDKANLTVLLKHRFGSGYDVEGYLSKFFSYSLGIQTAQRDVEFLLEKLVQQGLVADGLCQKGPDRFNGIEAAARGCLHGLGGATGKLRRLERCAERIALCVRAMSGVGWTYLIGFLVGLYMSDRDLFSAYLTGWYGEEMADKMKERVRKGAANDLDLSWIVAMSISENDWSARQNSISARFGRDKVQGVAQVRLQSIDSRISSHHSAADWAMQEIGWLLS